MIAFLKNPNNNTQEELNPLELAYPLLSRFLRVSLTQTKLQAVWRFQLLATTNTIYSYFYKGTHTFWKNNEKLITIDLAFESFELCHRSMQGKGREQKKKKNVGRCWEGLCNCRLWTPRPEDTLSNSRESVTSISHYHDPLQHPRSSLLCLPFRAGCSFFKWQRRCKALKIKE